MRDELYENGMTPINKLAARVVSKGVKYSPALKPGSEVEQKVPFPVRELSEIPPDLRHLIGYRFGRLTVMGFSHIPKRWSVRCSCGIFCIRTTKAICNPKNVNDACCACRAILQLLRNDHFKRTGKNVAIESLPQALTARAPLPPRVHSGPRYVTHNSTRSCDPLPRRTEPTHWTAQQRDIPTSLASAFHAAAEEYAERAANRKPKGK